jgi:hypothetical protein
MLFYCVFTSESLNQLPVNRKTKAINYKEAGG